MDNESLLDNADVRWDARRARPVKVRGDFPLPAADAPDDAVKLFLSEHGDELRLPSAERDLELIHTAETPTGRVLRFEQIYEGLPVFGTEVRVAVDTEQHVREVDLAVEPEPHPVATDADSKLKPREAVQAAMAVLGDVTTRRRTPTPQEVYFPTDDGLRAAYLVLVATREPAHDWRVIVDAHSGEILEQEDILFRMPDGNGLVFDPNPVVTSGTATLRDPDATVATCGFAGSPRATIDAQRVSRALRDITQAGAIFRLEGPYVRMHNFGAPATTFPEEANANDFNYSSGDERFECVNVYFHIDRLQRYLQDGSQGPAITTAHNAQIPCDPHEGSGAAFFSSLDGGLHFSNSGPCRPDRAEDAHVMVHEYGHAIQHNQVPTWGGTNPVTGRQETRAMGEGFGDALACIFFAPDQPFMREVFEQWIFGDVGGLRRVDGTKVYPTAWVSQVHSDGEIWSAALWNIYRAAGGDSAVPSVRRAARDAVLKSLVLSHHRLAGNASMPDGAESLMVEHAALDAYRGRHLMPMLDSFHARGLLPCPTAANLTIIDGPTFWNSPDLWIRNSDDGGTTHQAPEAGQDNWFYARVRNTGTATARAFVVTFNVKPWAGTEFVYPNDFLPCIAAVTGRDLAPGGSRVVKAKWPAALVPPAGTHACWLASVYTPTDLTPAGRHVWEHDNLAQKNLTVVDLVAGDSVLIPVQLGNLGQLLGGRRFLEVQRPEGWRSLAVSLVDPNPQVVRLLAHSAETLPAPERGTLQPRPQVRFLEPAVVEIAHRGVLTEPVRISLTRDSVVDLGPAEPEPDRSAASPDTGDVDLVTDGDGLTALAFRSGTAAAFPIGLGARVTKSVQLKLTAPASAKPGDVIPVDFVQKDEQGRIMGGVTIHINVVAR